MRTSTRPAVRRPKRVKHKLRRFFILIIILIIVASGGLYIRPVPAIYAVNDLKTAALAEQQLSWPATGEAAIGASGYGVLATHGQQTARPTASVAKLITILAVLQKYPLLEGQQGPTITLGQNDVNIFNKYFAEDGSLAAVKAGEKISEYQMMEGILLPSANNLADSLAIWAFGSLKAYSTYANNFVRSLGLTGTTIGADASGFLPSTRSTAHDLVSMGIAALSQPVIAEIVSEKQASIPVAGAIDNVNFLLGQDGIDGVKTGNTDQAGGVYVFSAAYAVDATHSVRIVGAIEGTKTLPQALDGAMPLLNSAKINFKLTTVIKKGQVVGQYNLPWATSVNAIAAEDLKAVTWLGAPSRPIFALHAIYAPQAAGSTVGELQINPADTSGSSTPVVLQNDLPAPGISWRIFGRHLHL